MIYPAPFREEYLPAVRQTGYQKIPYLPGSFYSAHKGAGFIKPFR